MASTRTAIRTCPLCEATCGLELTLEADRVTKVRGDARDVFSRGYICPKGAAFGQLEADPDRLRRPLVKRDGVFVETGWDEAFDVIAQRLPAILDEHGRDSVAIYLGNPNVHNLSGSLYVRPFVKALGTRNVFTATTVDQMPKHVSCGWMFGDPLAIPVPDIDRTDHLLMLGANPRMSNGSLWTAPDLPARLDALRARGGKLVVVDPRRSRTASKADEHHFIRPGTDAALLAALAHTLVDEGRVSLGAHLEQHVRGLDDVTAAVAPFAPEVVADNTGIPAADIRRMARELAAADRAVVYGRIGTTTVSFGTITSWLVDVCNALTGNLDRVGGAMFPSPAHTPDRAGRRAYRTGRWHSRVSGYREANGELPVTALAEEIETPGEGQIRALVTVAGNPVLSTPNSQRLDRALASLELMVSVDPYLNETTRHADVILPPPPALQRGHYDLAFYGLSIRNVANYSPPVLAPQQEDPDEWELLLRLSGIALGQGADPDIEVADAFVASQLAASMVTNPASRAYGRTPQDVLVAVAPRRGPERLLDVLLRSGPYGDGFGSHPDGLSLAHLEARPHGVDLGPLVPRLPGNLATGSQAVELAPQGCLDDLSRLRAAIDQPPARYLLVGRRHLRTNNSWMHNLPMLQGASELCTLQISPADAAALGLEAGGAAKISTRVGAVVAPVEVTDDIMPGVVSLPHGFGHDLEGVRMEVAAARPGVNSNVLSEGEVDPLSGNAVLSAIPVEIAAA